MKRPVGHTAEPMERSRDVGFDQLKGCKGSRPGEARHGSVDPGWPPFKGTRVGRNPDRSQKDMVGVTKPERGTPSGVPTFKPNLFEHRKPKEPTEHEPSTV